MTTLKFGSSNSCFRSTEVTGHTDSRHGAEDLIHASNLLGQLSTHWAIFPALGLLFWPVEPLRIERVAKPRAFPLRDHQCDVAGEKVTPAFPLGNGLSGNLVLKPVSTTQSPGPSPYPTSSFLVPTETGDCWAPSCLKLPWLQILARQLFCLKCHKRFPQPWARRILLIKPSRPFWRWLLLGSQAWCLAFLLPILQA